MLIGEFNFTLLNFTWLPVLVYVIVVITALVWVTRFSAHHQDFNEWEQEMKQ